MPTTPPLVQKKTVRGCFPIKRHAKGEEERGGKMEEKLYSIYYDPKHPTSISPIIKLAKASGCSKAKVKKWVNAQPTHFIVKLRKRMLRESIGADKKI